VNWDLFKPSTWLKRFIVKLLERVTSSFYEVAAPPRRLAERVRLFQVYNANASPEQWVQFALTFGQNCYREGFTRGYEWQERGWPGPAVDPDHLAEIEAQDWSLAEQHRGWREILELGYDPNSPLAHLSSEQRTAIAETLQGAGPFPVHLDLSPYDKEQSDE
jgi:hypothetical protein